METKSCELSIKQMSEGKVVATLARLGVIDRDGDVLTTGLVKGHQIVAIKPQHKWEHVNLGVADIYETPDNTMEAAMEFNMAIPSAKDWFEAIRFSHEKNHRQQYSFGFHVVDFDRGQHSGKSVRFLKEIEIAECSPVLIGASIGSATLSVKNQEEERQRVSEESKEQPAVEVSRKLPAQNLPVAKDTWHVVGVHHTGIDDSPFEAVRQYKRVQSSQAAGLYRSAFALQWPGTQADMKESWGLLHHVIDDDGKPGAASLHACLIGISLLKGWDGLFVPEDVRERLHAHYATHLLDGGYDVPDLIKRDSGVEIKHELKFWLWQAKSVLDRRDRVKEFLVRVGKDESKEMVEQFDQLYRFVTHMHRVAGSAGDAMNHLEEQEELSLRAAQISREVSEDELREEAVKQAELKEFFERFRVNHG